MRHIATLAAFAAAAALMGCNPNVVMPPTTPGVTTGFGLAGPSVPGTATGTAAAQPGAATGTAGTAAASATIATGAGGTLTRDAADAFVEAFEFSLAQIGRPKTFTAAEREQLVQAIGQSFAKQPPEQQRALVDARATWTRTKAGWATMDPVAQQAFVDGVLQIGVGDQAAAQLTGRAAAGGATGGGSGGGDSWSAEAQDKCQNGNFDDQMFYCHGVITPSVPWK